MKIMKFFPCVAALSLILFIFRGWFSNGSLSSGDWLYKFPESLSGIPLIPFVWDPLFGEKLGSNTSFILALNTYYVDTGFFVTNILHLPWEFLERAVWFFPCILIAFFGARYLFLILFKDSNEIFKSFAGFIYVVNTFFLMTVGGGQIAIGIAYAFVPIIVARVVVLIQSCQKNHVDKIKLLRLSGIIGLIFAIQVLFDLRIAYITLAAVLLEILVLTPKNKVLVSVLFALLIPLILTGLLHAFWLLPFVWVGHSPIEQLGSGYSSTDALKFFSFAKFENAFGLMHPYWPENIFGKVGFMKAEFLVLPIVAFSSLIFIDNKKQFQKRIILFFALLGLLGIFLAKGSNDPFGGIYVWMFENIPGVEMFRDPLKWYSLIAVSYSVLIPFSIFSMYQLLHSHRIPLPKAFVVVTIVAFLLLNRPAIDGSLGGTFKPEEVPADYKKFEKLVASQDDYSRTFWVPRPSNLAFTSYTHPRMTASDYLRIFDDQKLLKQVSKDSTRVLLQEASVKYIVVPYDSRKSIFINDRAFSERDFKKTKQTVQNIAWLKKVNGFKTMAVFELKDYKKHVWISDVNANVSFSMVEPTKYSVKVQNVKKGDRLIFSEAFDSEWVGRVGNITLESKKYKERFNSFILLQKGTYEVTIFYKPQQYVKYGLIISVITLVMLVMGGLFIRKKK